MQPSTASKQSSAVTFQTAWECEDDCDLINGSALMSNIFLNRHPCFSSPCHLQGCPQKESLFIYCRALIIAGWGWETGTLELCKTFLTFMFDNRSSRQKKKKEQEVFELMHRTDWTKAREETWRGHHGVYVSNELLSTRFPYPVASFVLLDAFHLQTGSSGQKLCSSLG